MSLKNTNNCNTDTTLYLVFTVCRIHKVAIPSGVSSEPDAQHRQEWVPDELHLRAGRGHDPERRTRSQSRKLPHEGAEVRQVRLRRPRVRDFDQGNSLAKQ